MSSASFETIATEGTSPGYWSGVLRRLGREPVAMFALLVNLAMVLMAVFAPLIGPADP